MRTHLFVVIAPSFDQHGGLATRTEPFNGQALVAELAIEALVGAVLPGLTGIVEHSGDARVREPLQDGLTNYCAFTTARSSRIACLPVRSASPAATMSSTSCAKSWASSTG